MTPWDDSYRRAVDDALRALRVDALVFGIHDASLPAFPDEDLGHGSPYSRGAHALFAHARTLGFTGVQLGPQGETSRDNPSPYDGTAFSKNPLLTSLPWLVERRLLTDADARELALTPQSHFADRVAYTVAYDRSREALSRAFARADHLRVALDTFSAHNASWIEPGVLFPLLQSLHGAWSPERWSDPLDARLYDPLPEHLSDARARRAFLLDTHAVEHRRHVFEQWCLSEQHRALRDRCAALGLRLYGDLHVGLGAQDLWRWRSIFLPGYRMGAPPSRTNPEGQPWGYPVLDPDQRAGAVSDYLRARFEKLLDEFDGLRVDHPHGLVCPWVYRADTSDPHAAVRAGARLYESPDLDDHPDLARFAVVSPAQIDRSQPRHADRWARELTPAQVDRYAWAFDLLVAAARDRGRATHDLVCEVLSTRPAPLAAVTARHGLGRFCITQKAKPTDPDDVYRSENALAEDWIMVGNHDTRTIWSVAAEQVSSGAASPFAAQLAGVLSGGDPSRRERWERALTHDASLLAHARLAELFTSRARSVMVYFCDLYGMRESYNVPGTVTADNWSLRLAPEHRERHLAAAREGRALDPAWAMAVALTATRGDRDLIARLRALAVSPHPVEP